uniref:Uncharacterized protein n=1 Tax=Erpetoichthys calabaricus TaxID=27687 RepID=A0A8C4SLE7_ERPCA
MVRTKAHRVPVSYGKAGVETSARPSLAGSSSNKYAGGNLVCPQPSLCWEPWKEKENMFHSNEEEVEAGGSDIGKSTRKSRQRSDEA